MTGNYEYSCSNRENLQLPIQVKLSRNQKHFVVLWLYFCSAIIMSLIGQVFLKLLTPNMCLFKCITGLPSENPLRENVLSTPNNSWNLKTSTFILLFLHSGPNWVRKSYFQWDLRFEDCLITRWLQTSSILVVIESIYGYQYKSNSLKINQTFVLFCLHFWNLNEIYNVLKKKWAS